MDWNDWTERCNNWLCFGEVPVGFTNDSKTAFIGNDQDVLVVDVDSGQQLRLLQHSARVIGIHFALPDKLLTYTNEGVQTVWHTKAWKIIRCGDLNFAPISVSHFDDNYLLAVSESESKELLVTKIGENVDASQRVEIQRTAPHNISPMQFAVTEKYLVCCEELFVYLYLYGTKSAQRFKYIGKAEFMSSALLKFHTIAACGETIAASLSFGRTFIWNNVCSKGIGSFSQSIHWHKWGPLLALSPSGSLISAGPEAAIARFTLSTSKRTSKPQLLPRLQTSVSRLSLSPDGSILSVSLRDNSNHFVLLSTMSILSSTPSILCSPNGAKFPLTIDPLNPNLIVHSARPGVIHWFNSYMMTTTFTFDISKENVVEADNIFSRSYHYTDVCAIAFSFKFVLTVDSQSSTFCPDTRLQFWRRNNDLGALTLENIVGFGDRRVKCVRASLDAEVFITVDTEGLICKWERSENEERKWKKVHEVKWMGMCALHVSQIKNSLFAAIHEIDATDSMLTIWRVEPNEPLRLEYIHHGDRYVHQVEWCAMNSNNGRDVLLISSKTCLYAFNVETTTILWAVCESNLEIAISSQHPVVYSKNDKSIGEVGNNTVIELWVIDCAKGSILCQRTLKREPKSVVAIGSDETFAVVAAYEKGYTVLANSSVLEENHKQLLRKKAAVREMPFAKVSSIEYDDDSKIDDDNEVMQLETPSAIHMLDGAAYTLAPVPYLAPKFIRSCLLPPRR